MMLFPPRARCVRLATTAFIAACLALPLTLHAQQDDSFIARYQARVSATQAEQPHWVTPLVTVTPRLEQEFRTDFVHQYNNSGHEIWNYGNGKGLELIPEKHTELIFNIPPFFDRSNGESDGFGFLLVRIDDGNKLLRSNIEFGGEFPPSLYRQKLTLRSTLVR